MNDPADLETRVARLEAAAAIRQLPARYAAHYGSLDFDPMADLYAVEPSRPRGRGRDQVRRDLAASAEGDDGVRMAFLQNGSHVIDFVDDDHATGSVHCHGEVERGDGAWFHQAIHYGDRYVRHEGRWYFDGHRRHELFYGADGGTRPNDLPPADWPRNDTGRGTVPHRWESWRRFWAADEPTSRNLDNG